MEPGLPRPSHWNCVTETGSIKGRASSSVGAETPREADEPCSFLVADSAAAPSGTLPARELASAMGLPLATYLEETEDSPVIQVYPKGRKRPRDRQPQSGCSSAHVATGIPTDPVADHYTTVKSLGWGPVE